MEKIQKARDHLYSALAGILSGGCKNETSIHVQAALQYLHEYEEELDLGTLPHPGEDNSK